MSLQGKNWNRRLVENAGRTTVRHRHRPAVLALTTLTVLSAMVGLVADVRLHAWQLADSCYAAACLFGAMLLAFLYSKRLRVTRRP